MKYKVTVQGHSHVVEIEDINERPVIAHVDGVRFEVMPEKNPPMEEDQAEVRHEAKEVHSLDLRNPPSNPGGNELTAPLPGTVLEIFVKAGDIIEAGQVLVIIEAMKMKNSIRSTRGGRIAEVLVDPMQTVAHKQPLVRFE
jgi:biotin carboxyl carrier protein